MKTNSKGGDFVSLDKNTHSAYNKLKKKKKKKKNYPQPSQLQLNQLINLFQKGLDAQTEDLANSIAKQYPNHSLAWKILGGIYLKTGKLSLAIAAAKHAVRADPEDPEAHNTLGVILNNLSSFQASAQSFKNAVLLAPNNAVFHLNQANALKKICAFDSAESVYRRAIAINPHFSDAQFALADLYFKLNKFDKAENRYKIVLKSNPNYENINFNLASTLFAAGKLEEAELFYRKSILLNPATAQAYFNLGLTLSLQGKLDEAEASYRQALHLNQKDIGTYNNLTALLKSQNRLKEAEAICHAAIKIAPHDSSTHFNLAVVLQEQRRFLEAVASYKEAISLDPKNPEMHKNLGTSLSQLNRTKEAEESYTTAVNLDPNYVQASHLLAALLGETPDSAPREYVETLFDNYAENFETSLVGDLKYEFPKTIMKIVQEATGQTALGSVVDLGCGTGLAGVEVEPFCTRLEGIDLSSSMLKIAEQKHIYQRLIHQDITHYLKTTKLNFDYFIAADVFLYLGDLTEVFQLIKSQNQKSGKLLFSTEHNDDLNFVLERSGRYSHSKHYIQNLCSQFDFHISYFKKVNLRKDNDNWILGGLYLLDF